MAKTQLYRLVREWRQESVDEDDRMTPSVAAEALGVTITGVIQWMDDGTLPCYSVVDEGKLIASPTGRKTERLQRYTSRKHVEALKKGRAGAPKQEKAGVDKDKRLYGALPTHLIGAPA
jgi:hypothetical protein